MKNPLERLLQDTGLGNSYFQTTSRYYGLQTKSLETNDYKKVAYVERRFISQPDEYQILQEHTVGRNDRLDNIAHQYIGDPEQFWRICDANAALHPNELTKNISDTTKITMPQGVSKSG